MHKQKSFTLIELMTVIGIIAILAGLMLVGYNIFFSEANIGSSMRFDSSIHHSLGYALVGDWKMDDNAANSTVVDTSGNGNDGTFYSSSTEDNTANHSVDGANGRALDFDGVDDYVSTPLTPQNLDKPFTISFWGNISSSLDGSSGIVETGDWSGGKGFYTSSNSLIAAIRDTSTAFYATIDISLVVDKWHFFCGTYDGETLKLYVDGEMKDSDSYAALSEPAEHNWNIGDAGIISGSGAIFFEGRLDQIRIYKKNLTISQIKQQHYIGLQRLYKKGLISREEYIKKSFEKNLINNFNFNVIFN